MAWHVFSFDFFKAKDEIAVVVATIPVNNRSDYLGIQSTYFLRGKTSTQSAQQPDNFLLEL